MGKKSGLGLTAVIAGIATASGILAYKINKEHRTFSIEKWNGDISKRYKMADDLIRSEILKGKTRKEILDFLGINGLRSNTKTTMEYYLNLDTEEPKMLILEFDEDEKLINSTACI